jgi:hypothetical protein
LRIDRSLAEVKLIIGVFALSVTQSAKPRHKRHSCFAEVRMRLKDKIAIVVGAGQSPGEGLGNGRDTVLRFAQDGARVLAVDNNFSSAEETILHYDVGVSIAMSALSMWPRYIR